MCLFLSGSDARYTQAARGEQIQNALVFMLLLVGFCDILKYNIDENAKRYGFGLLCVN